MILIHYGVPLVMDTHDIIFGQVCLQWYSIEMTEGRKSLPS